MPLCTPSLLSLFITQTGLSWHQRLLVVSVHLSLFSAPCDGISTSCLISLYLSIPLWMAIERGFLCLTISSTQIAVICILDVLEWLMSQRFGPQYGTIGKLWCLERWGLLGHLYVTENTLEGDRGSCYVLSSCALALPLFLCNMFSYHRPSATQPIRLEAPKTTIWDNLLILIN